MSSSLLSSVSHQQSHPITNLYSTAPISPIYTQQRLYPFISSGLASLDKIQLGYNKTIGRHDFNGANEVGCYILSVTSHVCLTVNDDNIHIQCIPHHHLITESIIIITVINIITITIIIIITITDDDGDDDDDDDDDIIINLGFNLFLVLHREN